MPPPQLPMPLAGIPPSVLLVKVQPISVIVLWSPASPPPLPPMPFPRLTELPVKVQLVSDTGPLAYMPPPLFPMPFVEMPPSELSVKVQFVSVAAPPADMPPPLPPMPPCPARPAFELPRNVTLVSVNDAPEDSYRP